jgi:hypothetical protein
MVGMITPLRASTIDMVKETWLNHIADVAKFQAIQQNKIPTPYLN